MQSPRRYEREQTAFAVVGTEVMFIRIKPLTWQASAMVGTTIHRSPHTDAAMQRFVCARHPTFELIAMQTPLQDKPGTGA